MEASNLKEQEEVVLSFVTICRSEYEEEHRSLVEGGSTWDWKDFLAETCHVCEEKPWVRDVQSGCPPHVDSGASYDYIMRFAKEPYLIICEECFEEHFGDKDWRWGNRY